MFPAYLIPVFAVEALLLTIHLTVTAFIAYKLARSEPQFRGGFYKIFLAQCFVEYVCFLEVGKNCASNGLSDREVD